MIQQDYILRQVHQLAQVLALILFHKRVEQPDQAQAALAEGLQSALGLDLAALRSLPREELLALCRPGGVLAGERAVAVADLLREDESDAGRARALWLYEVALASEEPVPLDIYDRMAALRAPIP